MLNIIYRLYIDIFDTETNIKKYKYICLKLS